MHACQSAYDLFDQEIGQFALTKSDFIFMWRKLRVCSFAFIRFCFSIILDYFFNKIGIYLNCICIVYLCIPNLDVGKNKEKRLYSGVVRVIPILFPILKQGEYIRNWFFFHSLFSTQRWLIFFIIQLSIKLKLCLPILYSTHLHSYRIYIYISSNACVHITPYYYL